MIKYTISPCEEHGQQHMSHTELIKSMYYLYSIFPSFPGVQRYPVSGEYLLAVLLQYNCVCSQSVSPSPLHIAACGYSGAELIVQLSQSSIAILCAPPGLRLGRDGTRH